MSSKKIAIIGCGISGLQTALTLLKQNTTISELTLFEKTNKIGGCLQSDQTSGYVLENAAQGVLLNHSEFTDIVLNSKLESKLIAPQMKNLKRYLIRSNSTLPIQPFSIAKILGCIGLLRFLGEFIISPKIIANETLYEFLQRRFGKKFANVFAVPMASGIWAGGAQRILIRHVFPKLIQMEHEHGSLIKGIFKTQFFQNRKKSKSNISISGLGSFQNGMQELPQELFAQIQILCTEKNISLKMIYNHEVKHINNSNSHFYVDTKGPFHACVFAIPPWQQKLLSFSGEWENQTQERFKILQNIPTHNAVVVGIGGKNSTPNIQGFGALTNTDSKYILGVLFVHSIYPMHVPAGNFLFRFILGGDRAPDIVNNSHEELIQICLDFALEKQLIDKNSTVDFKKVILWPQAIPLATESHDLTLRTIWQIEASTPGFFLTGNYIDGVGVADCLRQGEITAKKINVFLNQVTPT